MVALGAVGFTGGSIVMAQTYRWVPFGTVSSSWAANGNNIYNTNVGSVVIGGLAPDGTLELDVAGSIGAGGYCDGAGANCFTATDMQWEVSGNNMYTLVAGNVGIGTATVGQKLTVDGNVLADAYFYVSDQQLKQNIHPITNGLDIVTQLQGVTFNRVNSKETSIGLVAQQVETVLPELVFTDPTTGYKSVQYANVVAPLIEAIKEQQIEIDRLEQLVSELE